MKFITGFPQNFLRILSLVLVLSSCTTEENDSDDLSKDNGFEINGDFHPLSQSFIRLKDYVVEQQEPTLYHHDIVVTSSGINLDAANEAFVGTGHAITFTLSSRSEDHVVNGTYSYLDGDKEFDLIDGEVMVQGNSYNGAGTIYGIDGGSITVNNDGDKISFQFDLVLDNSLKVQGSYEGEYEFYNFSL